MTLPDPYRGHAAPSWDTRTLASLIGAMGGPGAGAPPSQAAADGRYAFSPLQVWLDVANGNGVDTITPVGNASWTTISFLGGTVNANNGGGLWTPSTSFYRTPLAGTYFCQALVRIADGFGTNCNLGIGIGTANADGAHFQWNKYVTGSGGRCAFAYHRIAGFGQNVDLRLYCFQDSGTTMALTRAALQLWRLC